MFELVSGAEGFFCSAASLMPMNQSWSTLLLSVMLWFCWLFCSSPTRDLDQAAAWWISLGSESFFRNRLI
jgi:hypothetical protein